MTTMQATDTEHQRSLNNILTFLDAYRPASQEKASAVEALRDRIRQHPHRQDVLALADSIQGTPFTLRRGTIKALPGLATRTRACGWNMELQHSPAQEE